MESVTSQLIATQNDDSAGGVAAPAPTASAVKMTALVTQWTVMETAGATGWGERRSRKVAATSENIPRNGTR